jgi:hypothetical protein
MRQRCMNERNIHCADYGGRGIKVCKRWKDFASFLEDMGPRPKGTYLDRCDNDGNYTPQNCRWASRADSSRNTRRAVLVTVDGRTQTLAAWADELGVRYRTLYYRIYSYGWTPEEAVTTPVVSK